MGRNRDYGRAGAAAHAHQVYEPNRLIHGLVGGDPNHHVVMVEGGVQGRELLFRRREPIGAQLFKGFDNNDVGDIIYIR